jgi:dihydrolipoamide dehydrogenase
MESFDCAVIGGGPGGYVAAIRLAQLGKRVALIERYSQLGGTCTHVGCIPSKALLDSSERFFEAKKHFKTHGITASELSFDWATMQGRKEKVVKITALGISKLMEKNGIQVFHGKARFLDPHSLQVEETTRDSTEISTPPFTLRADHIIVATGSKAIDLPFCHFVKSRILSSTEALCLKEVPKTLLVVGAGVIGLELGSVYARLGAKVVVVEALNRCLPTMDPDLGKELEKTLKRLGMKFHLGARLEAVQVDPEGVTCRVTTAKGKPIEIRADHCLLAIGRKAHTEGLDLELAGLTTDSQGFLPVNEIGQSSVDHIWGIGDVVGGLMLAHKAEEEGVAVAQCIAGGKGHVDANLIPGVVYTWPEVATVGQTEEDLIQSGVAYKVGTFPFVALGRARAAGEKDGFVKVIACKESDRVLGVHMIGPRVADMIGQAATAIQMGATAKEVGESCQAHPTFTEALKEAAMQASEARALHL